MTISPGVEPHDDPVLNAVVDLAKTCESEYEHVTHVSYLALRLFDDMKPMHGLGDDDRFLLQSASILHDIGWVEGWRSHHKAALRIILETPLLPFSNHDRLIIGSIARYHRKALPMMAHDHFAALSFEDRKKVQILAGFLRLADGLDRTHGRKIRDVKCRIKKNRILIDCASSFSAQEELDGGTEKADLLSLVFDKEVIITIKSRL
jgi:exopolyphosphatase/pppGpp-phosphohydrolase